MRLWVEMWVKLLVEVVVIVVFLTVLGWAISVAIQEVFGNTPAPRDIHALTESLPYSEDLEERAKKKVSEMRQRLFLLGCKRSGGYWIMENKVLVITLACQDTE